MKEPGQDANSKHEANSKQGACSMKNGKRTSPTGGVRFFLCSRFSWIQGSKTVVNLQQAKYNGNREQTGHRRLSAGRRHYGFLWEMRKTTA